MRNRPLGEKMNRSGIAPIEHDETALSHSFFEARGNMIAHVIQLFPRIQHHGDLQRRNRGIDSA